MYAEFFRRSVQMTAINFAMHQKLRCMGCLRQVTEPFCFRLSLSMCAKGRVRPTFLEGRVKWNPVYKTVCACYKCILDT